MRRVMRGILVAVLSAVVLSLAAAVTFGCWSFYVLTSEDNAALQPGTVRYETREFWLSIDDIRKGRNQWTAELPDIVKRSH